MVVEYRNWEQAAFRLIAQKECLIWRNRARRRDDGRCPKIGDAPLAQTLQATAEEVSLLTTRQLERKKNGESGT